jgi:adenosylcobinamide kinase / adenosylcobinamide-phosphate guanylyltransferase
MLLRLLRHPSTVSSGEQCKSFLHFVIGGSKSGKSLHAESVAAASGLPVSYLATYCTEGADEEMRARIERHRQRRPSHWKTIENRYDLRNQILENDGRLLLVDCLTLWLSFQQMQARSSESILVELEEAMQTAFQHERALIVVSNEVGTGLVASTPEGRNFRDLCGSANQLVARYATTVEYLVAGLPLVLKGGA